MIVAVRLGIKQTASRPGWRPSPAVQIMAARVHSERGRAMPEKKPKRKPIPQALRASVLAEFRNRCAICGDHGPQIDHIDDDPSNNARENLIPLCPNCHIRDKHNPTAPVDRGKLALFRRHKDPAILHPRFEPIWRRTQFMRSPDGLSHGELLHNGVTNLAAFLTTFTKGAYYAARIRELLMTNYGGGIDLDNLEAEMRNRAQLFAQGIVKNRDEAIDLIVEMLRYQDWDVPGADP
jgi:hypothetical protein